MAAVAAPAPIQPASAARTRAHVPFHIPSLDGLRAVSFFIVFLAHAGLDRIVPGGFGVTVFFFLSGYLITTLMRMEAAKTRTVSLKHFYLRRVLRILPPFYIVLCTATGLAAVDFLHGDVPLQTLPVLSQMLHFSNYWIAAHGWGGVAVGTGVYWSLAVEEHFYFVFPITFLTLHRLRLTGRQMAFAFWGLCALVLAWRCILIVGLHSQVDRTYLCSDTRIDSIAFGCALAVWNNPILDAPADTEDSSRLWKGLLLPAGVALLLVTFLLRGPVFRETFRYTLQGIALTPVFVSAVRWPNALVFRGLNWRPVRFVGTLSYSLYLVHQAALAAIRQHSPLGPVASAVVALVVSFALSWAMYRAVERPCARLRRRLSAAD